MCPSWYWGHLLEASIVQCEQTFSLFSGDACKKMHNLSKLSTQSGPLESAKFNRHLTLHTWFSCRISDPGAFPWDTFHELLKNPQWKMWRGGGVGGTHTDWIITMSAPSAPAVPAKCTKPFNHKIIKRNREHVNDGYFFRKRNIMIKFSFQTFFRASVSSKTNSVLPACPHLSHQTLFLPSVEI